MIKTITTTDPIVFQAILDEVRDKKGHIEDCAQTYLWIERKQVWYEYYTPGSNYDRIVIDDPDEEYNDAELIRWLLEDMGVYFGKGCPLKYFIPEEAADDPD